MVERKPRASRFPDEMIIENINCQIRDVLKVAPGSIISRIRFHSLLLFHISSFNLVNPQNFQKVKKSDRKLTLRFA